MWYSWINRLVLALAVALGLLIATASRSEVTSLDPLQPASALLLVTSRLHTVESYVRDRIGAVTVRVRERVRAARANDALVP